MKLDRPLDESARSAHRLYVHLAWPNLGRLPLVPTDLRGPAEWQLISLCRRLDVEPVCVRVFSDRAHALVRVKPSHAVGRLVRRLKVGSEEALAASGRSVRWGRAYAATTVGPAEVRDSMRRIASAPERDFRAGRRFARRRKGRPERRRGLHRS